MIRRLYFPSKHSSQEKSFILLSLLTSVIRFHSVTDHEKQALRQSVENASLDEIKIFMN